MVYEITLNNKFTINILKWKKINEIREENTSRLKLKRLHPAIKLHAACHFSIHKQSKDTFKCDKSRVLYSN